MTPEQQAVEEALQRADILKRLRPEGHLAITLAAEVRRLREEVELLHRRALEHERLAREDVRDAVERRKPRLEEF